MMPGMDGLQLVAGLERSREPPPFRFYRRPREPAQEASIEGLQAGADLTSSNRSRPRGTAGGVRANIELARLRSHQARWRTALVVPSQIGVLRLRRDGAVVQLNNAFTEILGYGTQQLPYPATDPWWPTPTPIPKLISLSNPCSRNAWESRAGGSTVPLNHRDGHRVWVVAIFNHAEDADMGRRSWSARCGTSRPSTTSCNVRPRWPHSISNWLWS